ncbi:hypothetical protein [Clostridium amazonitimonense]|uniref:hypothetical protein n=1 Tax=Clostridium amazonitimonense TaxID=1499689 RepID=UPI000509CAC2|nr:hypothetical protein [Clostridium amazonitimonense]
MKKSYISIVLMVSISMIILLRCLQKTATYNISNNDNKSTSTNSSEVKSDLYNLAIPENIVYYRD